jgi:hypothetical protein
LIYFVVQLKHSCHLVAKSRRVSHNRHSRIQLWLKLPPYVPGFPSSLIIILLGLLRHMLVAVLSGCAGLLWLMTSETYDNKFIISPRRAILHRIRMAVALSSAERPFQPVHRGRQGQEELPKCQ